MAKVPLRGEDQRDFAETALQANTAEDLLQELAVSSTKADLMLAGSLSRQSKRADWTFWKKNSFDEDYPNPVC